jgi:ankyrin repeat protein
MQVFNIKRSLDDEQQTAPLIKRSRPNSPHIPSTGAIFMVLFAIAKFKELLRMPVCIKFMDGRSITVKVPRRGSVADLRAAVAARAEVAATTLGLFVTGDDGEELRGNQRLVDVVGRNGGTAFALPGRDACWTCAECFYCRNDRSAMACGDCQLPRPSTGKQSAKLRAAARAGRLEGDKGVLALLSAAVPLDATFNSNSALTIACQAGHAGVAAALMAAGADYNEMQTTDWTLLHGASEAGHLAVVQALLAAGADKEAREWGGCTALHVASLYGNLAVVAALLDAGADKDATAAGGDTALHLASRQGHLAVVEALLDAGADKDATAAGGDTALHAASLYGNLAVVAALLDAGADKDATTGSTGQTAHSLALAGGYLKVAAALVCGAS